MTLVVSYAGKRADAPLGDGISRKAIVTLTQLAFTFRIQIITLVQAGPAQVLVQAQVLAQAQASGL
jgi:hypothetical protein